MNKFINLTYDVEKFFFESRMIAIRVLARANTLQNGIRNECPGAYVNGMFYFLADN